MFSVKEIIHISRFHNIGQGQFYSSTLYSRVYSQEFNYVIDCGSEIKEALNKEIKEYSNSFNPSNNSLDMLIVSHLHYDHVSGINNLLTKLRKKSITVKKFILPYFDGPTRIFLFLKWKSLFGTKIGKWFFDFIIDPLNYLVGNFGDVIEEISVIMPTNNKVPKIKTDKNIQMNDLKFGKLTGEELPEPNDFKKPKYSNQTRISYFRNYSTAIYGIIEFDFWFRHINGSVIRTFRAQARKAIYKEGGLEKIFTSLGKKRTFNKNPLVKVYQTLFENSPNIKDFNDTSLCVSITAIGKINQDKSIILPDVLKYDKTFYFWGLPTLYSRLITTKAIWLSEQFKVRSLADTSPLQYNNELNLEFGYLFTGDIMLRKKHLYEDFADHYLRKEEKIKILCIPHHGARSSWNPRIIDDFNNPFSIVSAGFDYQHGHPHYAITNYLDNKVPWVFVNEDTSFNHLIRLIFP